MHTDQIPEVAIFGEMRFQLSLLHLLCPNSPADQAVADQIEELTQLQRHGCALRDAELAS